MKYMESHDEITNSAARDLTGIKSENSMKNVFQKLEALSQYQRESGSSA
jgi:ATP-dependent DNA helicase RecG